MFIYIWFCCSSSDPLLCLLCLILSMSNGKREWHGVRLTLSWKLKQLIGLLDALSQMNAAIHARSYQTALVAGAAVSLGLILLVVKYLDLLVSGGYWVSISSWKALALLPFAIGASTPNHIEAFTWNLLNNRLPALCLLNTLAIWVWRN